MVFSNSLLLNYGHFKHPLGSIATEFPLSFSQTVSVVSCAIGQGDRNQTALPMLHSLAITGFKSYYGENYYGVTVNNFDSGLHWLAIGI